MINNVMDKMGLSDSEKAFIEKNHSSKILSKVKSIWQVVEDASEYA